MPPVAEISGAFLYNCTKIDGEMPFFFILFRLPYGFFLWYKFKYLYCIFLCMTNL